MPDWRAIAYPRTEIGFVGYGLHSLHKGGIRIKAVICGYKATVQLSAHYSYSCLVRQEIEILVKHRYRNTFSIAGRTDVFGVSYLRLSASIDMCVADIFL